eukprot:scaffold93764_cov19-Tisochrysis_lutea.AAC.1
MNIPSLRLPCSPQRLHPAWTGSLTGHADPPDAAGSTTTPLPCPLHFYCLSVPHASRNTHSGKGALLSTHTASNLGEQGARNAAMPDQQLQGQLEEGQQQIQQSQEGQAPEGVQHGSLPSPLVTQQQQQQQQQQQTLPHGTILGAALLLLNPATLDTHQHPSYTNHSSTPDMQLQPSYPDHFPTPDTLQHPICTDHSSHSDSAAQHASPDPSLYATARAPSLLSQELACLAHVMVSTLGEAPEEEAIPDAAAGVASLAGDSLIE